MKHYMEQPMEPKPQKYLILTTADAAVLAETLRSLKEPTADQERISARLTRDTGADIQEVVDALKAQPICSVCTFEGMSEACESIDARQLGRRLNRLLERARGER